VPTASASQNKRFLTASRGCLLNLRKNMTP
jgi:hypothetical protein